MGDFGCPRKIVNFKLQFLKIRNQKRDSGPQIEQLTMSPCAKSTLTHQLLKELHSKIPCYLKFFSKRQFQRSWGLKFTIQCKQFFIWSYWVKKLFLRGNDRHFWNLGVIKYALIPKCRSNYAIISKIVASIVKSMVQGGSKFDANIHL